MFRFFDFLYLSAYKVYHPYDKSPEFPAVCFVSGMQSFNILSQVLIYSMILEVKNFDFLKPLAVVTLVTLIIANYVRYVRIDKHSYEMIAAKWKEKDNKSQTRSRFGQFIYVFLSAVIFFGLIFF
jgi:hypothetical protein